MLSPFSQYSHEFEAPFSPVEKEFTPSTPTTTYMLGVEGTPRSVGYGENSWLSTIIVLMLVVIALNFNHCRQLFKNFRQNLLGMRQRANAFDNRTSNEIRTLFIIILLMCLSEGILLFSSAATAGIVNDDNGALYITMILAGVAMVYYVWQLAVYKIVGYAFTDKESTRQWITGFNASQALLSFMLIIPALIALFYSNAADEMLVIAVCCYILARILFICKGFRIFYTNFGSLLYFILYLCTLEIAPLLIIRRLSLSLLHYLELTA